jgi:predicted transposase YdaD
VLRNLYRLLERPQALQGRVFKKLFEQAEIAQYSDAERRMYEASQKEYWDYTSTLETAENKGIAKGLAKGRAEGEKIGIEKGEKIGIEKGEKIGMEKERKANARKMKEKGLSAEDIADVTGLSIEEIASLE